LSFDDRRFPFNFDLFASGHSVHGQSDANDPFPQAGDLLLAVTVHRRGHKVAFTDVDGLI
jgi:hypothetical protein